MKPGLNLKAFKRLEPYDAKVSCTVLRGRRFWQQNLCYPTLVFSLFIFLFSKLGTYSACSQNNACPAQQLQENFIQNSLQAVEIMKKNKEFQSFLTQSNQQRDAALENKNFQEIIASLQAQAPLKGTPFKHQRRDESQPGESSGHILGLDPRTKSMLCIFVSFSIGEKALLNLAQEAKVYGATLVFRGFKDNSYAKTVHTLQRIIQETGQGFLIDPELFALFGITAVPTYVLARPFHLSAQERSQTPLHDRLQGHVSIRYALETFAKEGDLQVEAKALLVNAPIEKKRVQ